MGKMRLPVIEITNCDVKLGCAKKNTQGIYTTRGGKKPEKKFAFRNRKKKEVD